MGQEAPEDELSLREQAVQFLQHPDIRDAPRERKRSFLEGKGIPSNEIHRLLDAPASDGGASAPETHASEHEPTKARPDPAAADSETGPAVPASSIPEPAAEPPVTDSNPSAEPPATLPPATDPTPSAAPPIITYPEFLVAAHRARARPTPLLAQPLLLPALYTSAFLAASSYALNALALRPMHDALTAARVDLFATAQHKLDELTARLEGAVSTIPPLPAAARKSVDVEGDAGSEASDPAELFHRDVGVQTLSAPPSPGASATAAAGPVGAAEEHGARLRALRERVAALRDAGDRGEAEEKEAGEGVGELRRYLDGLARGPKGGGASGLSFGVVKERGREEDEVAKVRAEIRSVKGVLLSARSFPSGFTGRARAFGNG